MPDRRVAIFLPSLRGGGAERVMASLANAFARRGLSVDLVLAEASGPYLSEIEPGVRVVDLRTRRISLSLPGLVRYLARERPAAMLSALRHANVVAIVARRVAGSRTRLVVSERSEPFAGQEPFGNNTLVDTAVAWLYPRADHIVAVSRCVANALADGIRLDPGKISVIYNPIDLGTVTALTALRPEHPFLAGGFSTIIAVGRLDAVKGYDTLLTAISLIEDKRRVRALVLGEGPLRARLQQLARELGIGAMVDFVGFQRNPLAWMAAADLFVHASRSDAMPNAMLQAIACGRPVVSTDCGGPAEILEQGRWGRLVPVDDPRALADAIAAALADDRPPDVMARARSFDAAVVTDSYLRTLGLA